MGTNHNIVTKHKSFDRTCLPTHPGIVHNFLARLPAIYASYGARIAYLSSLREVSIVDSATSRRPDIVSVSLEPAFLALGPYHLAAGINNHVVYYHCSDSSMITEQVSHPECPLRRPAEGFGSH